MTQSNSCYEFDAVCLGAVGMTAAWRRRKSVDINHVYSPCVVISQSSAIDNGVYYPATDVTVSGVVGLLALRAAVEEALKYEALAPRQNSEGDRR